MSTYFRDNLLRYLPAEFAYQDIAIGDLSDYLEVVSISMDEISTLIEDFTTIFDVDSCDAKYLPYLAKMINYPLSERDTVADQRTQLREAVSWYKRKGLHESFRILFYSFGYVINLVELWTRDYKRFHRYPGTFVPPVFKAVVYGTTSPTVTVSSNTNALRIRVDGSPAVDIRLTVGENRPLADIATEIRVRLVDIGGDCFVWPVDPEHPGNPLEGKLTIRSRSSGAESSIRLEPAQLSAYGALGLTEGTWYGYNPVVPDDWHELQENGGKWYKSPHFGIEVYSIRDYVLDPDEFWYIRDRIELVRPAHTVMDWIDYVKALSDAYSVAETEFIAELEPGVADVWPFPICIDRGRNTEYEYIRNGLVPNRSEFIRVSYKHNRQSLNNCPLRNEFEYTYTQMFRDSPTGPTPMPDRGTRLYYRTGVVSGEPLRDSCGFDAEELQIDLAWNEQQPWCTQLFRDGGVKYRDNPDTWFRDGSFTLITNRNPYYLDRDGEDLTLDRSGCYSPMDTDNYLLFSRADLPGVWFTTLAAMSDPDSLGITDVLPGPGELGPSLEPES